jgi:hypothetical protein
MVPKELDQIRIYDDWFRDKYAHWGKKLSYSGAANELNLVVDDFAETCDLKLTKKSRCLLEILILNLYYVHVVSEGHSCLDILTSGKNTGVGSISYRIYGCAHALIGQAVHALNNENIIKYQVGVKGYSTKIKLTEGLQLVTGRINPELIVEAREPVQCKDKDGNLVLPSDSISQKAKFNLVKRYNDLIVNTSISIGKYALYGPEKMVSRIFHDKSCQYDGRLYGALHQRIKKELRKAILIDGKETVEVDIKSTHPLIIYAIEGEDITLAKAKKPFDCSAEAIYEINSTAYYLKSTSKDSKREKTVRSLIKCLFVIMLNVELKAGESKSSFVDRVVKAYEGKSTYRPDKVKEEYLEQHLFLEEFEFENSLSFEYDDEGFETGRVKSIDEKFSFSPKEVVLEILDYHKPIASWFGSGAWKRLNKIESEILLEVVRHFTDKGIAVLTIHDSVRIAKEYEAELVDVYQQAIESQLGVRFSDKSTLVTIDRGGCSWDSGKMYSELLTTRLSNKLTR